MKELEVLDIIKIYKSEEKVSTKGKASKYRGCLSAGTADALLEHTEESRNEWEERFPTK